MATGEAIPLRGLEGVPGLPGAPQDLQAMQEEKALSSRGRGRLRGFLELRRPWGLKLNIQKMKIMASGPITSWEIDGETVSNFIFWGSRITADGDCSHEIKRRLLLGLSSATRQWPSARCETSSLPSKCSRCTLTCHSVLGILAHGRH